MMLRPSRVLLAGSPFLFVLCLAAAPAKAADPKAPPKWSAARITEPEDLDEIKALQDRVQTVVTKCTPSTVGILIGFGAGSGVIVTEDGLVLTAAHVITGEENAGKPTSYSSGRMCTLVLPDGKKVKGKTLGVNPDTDVGMVQITEKGPNEGKWPFSAIAKSEPLKKNQWVVSLGHPGGPKSGRPPVARLGRIEANTKEIVRTNCTLVGGDSGGPLFDLDGNVIGIHSRIGFTLAQNIHVPTEHFKKQWDDLIAGKVFGKAAASAAPPVVGVVFTDDENDDAWLTEVDEEGPATKAGLKAGDTIVKVNGETIKSIKRFREVIATKKPGDKVKITVRRGTSILTYDVTLGRKGDAK